ncbi:MAG: hypothetical protein U0792_23575 [Gemmataceae bacterium]
MLAARVGRELGPARDFFIAVVLAVDGVDEDVVLLGERGDIVERNEPVLVNRFISADEDQLHGAFLVAPLLFFDRGFADAGHQFSAAANGQTVQGLVNVIEIDRQVHVPANVALGGGIVAVAVAVETDAEIWGGFELGQFIHNVPQPDFRRIDQAVHAPGDIQANDEVDGRTLGNNWSRDRPGDWLLGRLLLGPHRCDDDPGEQGNCEGPGDSAN